MITKEMLRKFNIAVENLRDAAYPLYMELTLNKTLYSKKWRYAADRRFQEGVNLDRDVNNLSELVNWIEAAGLLEIEVRE